MHQWTHPQSTYISRVPQCACPLVGIGTLPPLSRKWVCPPPQNQRGEGTIACGWRVGGVPIPTTGEKAKHSAYSVATFLHKMHVNCKVCFRGCFEISGCNNFCFPIVKLGTLFQEDSIPYFLFSTLIKRKQNFLIYKEIQKGAVAKSSMTNGLLIYDQIFPHFLIY